MALDLRREPARQARCDLSDTDRRGQLYLRQIVRDLEGKVATLCWAKLPPGQKDLSAWVEQGATKEQVVELLRGAQPIDCQHLPDM